MGFAGAELGDVAADRVGLACEELVREAVWALRRYHETGDREFLGRCLGALDAHKLLRAAP